MARRVSLSIQRLCHWLTRHRHSCVKDGIRSWTPRRPYTPMPALYSASDETARDSASHSQHYPTAISRVAWDGPLHEIDIQTLIQKANPRDKNGVVARSRVVKKQERFIETEACSVCWTPRHLCMCPQLQTHSVVNLRLIVFMHYQEYMVQSNTGCMLLSLFPNSELIINDIPSEKDRLSRLLDRLDPQRTLVLFPHPEATSIPDYLGSYGDILVHPRLVTHVPHCGSIHGVDSSTPRHHLNRHHQGPNGDLEVEQFEVDANQLTLIVLDSVWSRAPKLHKALPSYLPRVQLSGEWSSLFQGLRTQPSKDRVSTLEAVALSVMQASPHLDLRHRSSHSENAQTEATRIASHMLRLLDHRVRILAPYNHVDSHLDDRIRSISTGNKV